jgi:cell division protein FtsN
MPTGFISFIIGVIVLVIVFLILYFSCGKSQAPSEAPKSQTTMDEPPKPSETKSEVDPFKSATPPSS